MSSSGIVLRGYGNGIGLELDFQGEFFVIGRVEAEAVHVAAEAVAEIIFPEMGLHIAHLIVRFGHHFGDIAVFQFVGIHELGVPKECFPLRFGRGDDHDLDHVFDCFEKEAADSLRIERDSNHFDPIFLRDEIVGGRVIGFWIERIAIFGGEKDGDGERRADGQKILAGKVDPERFACGSSISIGVSERVRKADFFPRIRDKKADLVRLSLSLGRLEGIEFCAGDVVEIEGEFQPARFEPFHRLFRAIDRQSS